MAPHIFQSETELQNIAEAVPSSLSFSVSEKLARYGSSALSGVEHLRLLVGKDSILCSAEHKYVNPQSRIMHSRQATRSE
jgi:hypothetical protein